VAGQALRHITPIHELNKNEGQFFVGTISSTGEMGLTAVSVYHRVQVLAAGLVRMSGVIP